MKIPLRYQTTDSDCVPTTFINALQYLFKRDEIPPVVIQRIMLYSLDTVNQYGECGKNGTTRLAVELIMQCLESFATDKFGFERCVYLSQKQIHLRKGSKILSCINRGGVALLRVRANRTGNVFHYMLAIGVDDDWLLMFDPYYRVNPFKGEDSKCLVWLGDKDPTGANLRIKRERLDSYEYEKYSMACIDDRECCLLERI